MYLWQSDSTLKELEADNLIKRKEYDQIPLKVEYSLTERGKSLIPLLDGLCAWGEKHKPWRNFERVIYLLHLTYAVENDERSVYPANLQNAFHTPSDPNWYAKLQQINEYIKRQEFFIDIEPYFYDTQGAMDYGFSVDGIHPDIRGKMLIGELISKNKNLFK